MKITVRTKQPNHFIQQASQLLWQRVHGDTQVDELQNKQNKGELITFDDLSETQFCALEDMAVRMSLHYDGSQGEKQGELQVLQILIKDYYTAAQIGKQMEDPTKGEARSYEETMDALMRRTEQLWHLEKDSL
jgi:hypothetical protein